MLLQEDLENFTGWVTEQGLVLPRVMALDIWLIFPQSYIQGSSKSGCTEQVSSRGHRFEQGISVKGINIVLSVYMYAIGVHEMHG